MKRIRRIARAKGVEMTLDEGARHSKVLFDGRWVTTIARHSDVPELTAKGAIRDAENWEG